MVDSAVLTSSYMMELLFFHFAFKKHKNKPNCTEKYTSRVLFIEFHFSTWKSENFQSTLNFAIMITFPCLFHKFAL